MTNSHFDYAPLNGKKVLITGGLGFIGKHFVARCLEREYFVINIDSVNYAADRVVMQEFTKSYHYRFMHNDINALEYLPECDFIVNFAAESHVDNSITSNLKFCESNFLGVQHLLELSRYKPPAEMPQFIQISTDEVYGDSLDNKFAESDPLRPSNPYSATKAAADMLVQSWGRTYSVPFNIVRPSNNYGCHQYPEKLIPKSSARMKRGLPAIMHGDGSYVRSWLHADDTAAAILTVMDKGETNTIYNVSGDTHLHNIEVLRNIAKILKVSENKAWVSVGNRVGQDVRYAMDDSSIRALGWNPKRDFEIELKKVVNEIDFNRFL